MMRPILRFMRRPALVLAFLAPVACGSVSGSSSSGEDAQMNDLSILYPLAHSQTEFDSYLAPSAPGRGGNLLPSSLVPSTGSLNTEAPDSLRVVALRLDPCFGHVGPITDPASCEAQLRLVFQPLSFTEGSTSAADASVHAFYSLSQAEFAEALHAIIQLRKASSQESDLGPLAVHPILSKEGVSGPMAQGLARIIATYAGGSNCVRIAAFSVIVPFGPRGSGAVAPAWDMEVFGVDHGELKALSIPSMPGATGVSFSAIMNPLVVQFSGSPPQSKDDMQLLADSQAFAKAASGAQKNAFESAVRIENPNFESALTIDCASCHLAQPARELVGAKFGFSLKDDPNAFVPDSEFVSARDFETTTSVDSESLNIHAFSYRASEPAISQRVINETAAIVAYVDGVHYSQ